MPYTYNIDLENGVIKDTVRLGQKFREMIPAEILEIDPSAAKDIGFSRTVIGQCYEAKESEEGIKCIKSGLDKGFVLGKCYEADPSWGKCYSSQD